MFIFITVFITSVSSPLSSRMHPMGAYRLNLPSKKILGALDSPISSATIVLNSYISVPSFYLFSFSTHLINHSHLYTHYVFYFPINCPTLRMTEAYNVVSSHSYKPFSLIGIPLSHKTSGAFSSFDCILHRHQSNTLYIEDP